MDVFQSRPAWKVQTTRTQNVLSAPSNRDVLRRPTENMLDLFVSSGSTFLLSFLLDNITSFHPDQTTTTPATKIHLPLPPTPAQHYGVLWNPGGSWWARSGLTHTFSG